MAVNHNGPNAAKCGKCQAHPRFHTIRGPITHPFHMPDSKK